MNETMARIRDGLDGLPIVDVHTHLGTRGMWRARTLADLVSYHWVHVELTRAAGHRFGADPQSDPDGFMREALPHFGTIRNTVNHYALMGILRDLYGLKERTLDETNWRAVDEAVRGQADNAQWFDGVLQRAGIEALAVCFREGSPGCRTAFIPYENGEYLYAVDSMACVRQIVGPDGALPQRAEELGDRIARRVAWLATECGVRALHVCPYPTDEYPGWSYCRGEAGEAILALQHLHSGQRLSPQERRALIDYTARATSSAAGEHGIVMQMFHGSVSHAQHRGRYLVPNVSYCDPAFLQTHAALFEACPGTLFDLFLGTRIPSHEAVTLARVYYNVLVSGAWWHAFSPTTMATMFRDRLEMLPSTVWNAFFSDGYLVEWVYGKLLVTKNVLARVLAELVGEGYLTEADAIDIAEQVLYATPMRVYGGEA